MTTEKWMKMTTDKNNGWIVHRIKNYGWKGHLRRGLLQNGWTPTTNGSYNGWNEKKKGSKVTSDTRNKISDKNKTGGNDNGKQKNGWQ
jgi:hypothetical protein